MNLLSPFPFQFSNKKQCWRFCQSKNLASKFFSKNIQPFFLLSSELYIAFRWRTVFEEKKNWGSRFHMLYSLTVEKSWKFTNIFTLSICHYKWRLSCKRRGREPKIHQPKKFINHCLKLSNTNFQSHKKTQ
jgi:hypothetical protein